MLCDDLPCFSRSRLQHVAQPQHVEEERRVVGRRRDVDRVLGDDGVEVARRGEPGQRRIGRGRRVERDLEAEAIGLRLQRRQIAGVERRRADEQRADAVGRVVAAVAADAAHDGHVRARVGDAAPLQRRGGERGHAVDLAGPIAERTSATR